MFDIRQPNEGDYPDLVRAGERSRATMTRTLEPCGRAAPSGAMPSVSATCSGRRCTGR